MKVYIIEHSDPNCENEFIAVCASMSVAKRYMFAHREEGKRWKILADSDGRYSCWDGRLTQWSINEYEVQS